MTLFTQLIGSGRPDVVYLHGLFGRGKNWAGIARALSEQGHPGVLFDLPDHGRSHWSERFDYQAMADEVAAELRLRLGSAPATTIVGHSMGGKVAMLLALQHPDLVKRLVVVDIAPDFSFGVQSSVPLVAAMRGLDLAGLTSRGEADRRLAGEIQDAAVRGFVLQNLKQERTADGNRWHWELNLELLGGNLDGVAGWPDMTGRSYAGPTLWVAGANSSYIRPEHEPRMRQLFPAVRLVTIAGAGHWVHAEAPGPLTAALGEFLNTTG